MADWVNQKFLVFSLHLPEDAKHHDTMGNTALGRGVKSIFSETEGKTVVQELSEMPKGVGFLKHKVKFHS